MAVSGDNQTLVACDLSRLIERDRIPVNVYDRQGCIRIAAGDQLTPKHIELLASLEQTAGGAYVRSDTSGGIAPPPAAVATPERVVRALAKQHGHPAGEDSRRHVRNPWNVTLVLELLEKCEDRVQRRTIKVAAHDISRGGFGFSYGQFIHPGTVVRTTFETLPQRPTLVGVVRHCAALGGMKHFVGVQFVEKTT